MATTLATITALRAALDAPESYFRTAQSLRWEDEEVMRSTLFAEARIQLEGVSYLLAMPLDEMALRRVERFVPLQRHLSCGVVPRIEILRDEMKFYTAGDKVHFCDIMLEAMPDALPLADALSQASGKEEAERLLAAIDMLETTLTKSGISHNNLRVENLLISDNCALYPIRWYYATEGVGGDKEALEALRKRVRQIAGDEELYPSRCDEAQPMLLNDYTFAGEMHEGMIAVENDEGWGFVNYRCEEVIRPQYLWANDFCEGRAEVQTEEGMGLIDKQGKYIIDPIYEAVEFDAGDGMVRVCQDNEWALFDYSGNRLSEWGTPIGGGVEHPARERITIIKTDKTLELWNRQNVLSSAADLRVTQLQYTPHAQTSTQYYMKVSSQAVS